MINITFPDGAVREFESGVTTFDIAQSISNSLAKKALAGKFNGKLIDTTRAITGLNNTTGNYDLVISNLVAPRGFKEVLVPTWSGVLATGTASN